MVSRLTDGAPHYAAILFLIGIHECLPEQSTREKLHYSDDRRSDRDKGLQFLIWELVILEINKVLKFKATCFFSHSSIHLSSCFTQEVSQSKQTETFTPETSLACGN